MNNRDIAILVVDDQATNVDVLLEILRRNGSPCRTTVRIESNTTATT